MAFADKSPAMMGIDEDRSIRDGEKCKTSKGEERRQQGSKIVDENGIYKQDMDSGLSVSDATDVAKKSSPIGPGSSEGCTTNHETPKQGIVAERVKTIESNIRAEIDSTNGIGAKPLIKAATQLTGSNGEDETGMLAENTVKLQIEEFERLAKSSSSATKKQLLKMMAALQQRGEGNDSVETLSCQTGVRVSRFNVDVGKVPVGKAPEVTARSNRLLKKPAEDEKEKSKQAPSGSEENDKNGSIVSSIGNQPLVEFGENDGRDDGEGSKESDDIENHVPGANLMCLPIFQPNEANVENTSHHETSSASTNNLAKSGAGGGDSDRIIPKNPDFKSAFMKSHSKLTNRLIELLADEMGVPEQKIRLKLISTLDVKDTVLPHGLALSLMEKLMASKRVKSSIELEVIDCLQFFKHSKWLVLEVAPLSLASLQPISRTAFTWQWLIDRSHPTNDDEAEVNEILHYNQDITQVPSTEELTVRVEMDESAADVSNCPDLFNPTLECEMVEDGGLMVER